MIHSEDTPAPAITERVPLSRVVRVLDVSDDGAVLAEVAGGAVRTFVIPLERVPAYRKLSTEEQDDAAHEIIAR